MFSDVISNKYFIIALIIALIVLLYLYSQKKTCEIEGMQSLQKNTKENLQENLHTPKINYPLVISSDSESTEYVIKPKKKKRSYFKKN